MTTDSVTRNRIWLRLILAVIGLGVLAALVVPAGSGWDFANFYDTGRRAIAGQIADIYDPASLIAGRTPQGNMAFWGAPLSAWFYAPLGLLPPAAALVAFKLIAVVATTTALLLLYRLTRRSAGLSSDQSSWYALVFAVLVLLYQPFWTIFRVGGQTTPLVLLLMVLGLRSYVDGKLFATAGWLVLAVLFKPAFLLVPAFLALVSPPRFALALAGTGAAVAAVSIALFGWPIHREFLEILLRGADKPSPWPFNSSLYIVADVFRPIADSIPIRRTGGWFPDALRLAIKLAVVGTTVVLAVLASRQLWAPARRRLFTFLLAISFCLLISQVVWEHYLAVLFIPLSFLVVCWPWLTRGERVHLLVILALCALQNLVLVSFFRDHVPIRSHLGLLAVSLVKAGPLLAYVGFLWFRRATIFRLVGTLRVEEATAPAALEPQ